MTSAFFKYAELIKNNSTYAKRMMQLSKSIFAEYPHPLTTKSKRIVRRFSKQPQELKDEVVNWWPRHPETCKLMYTLRDYGLYRDEHEDFKEEMVRLRILRGKLKPTKGEGNQSKAK
ncbi:unnamed protein product [Notodromas monacha]|uniref:Small ribosomal subunit protein mS33 n=1 Tax=Notodromas monacha TaxID=399045 RepID=A0A7R9BPX2_9CRUS|nr:unnamed protein product [Notodromas monacha]CAG0919470.1 unnamed protein product [Notodromas monacha]